MIKHLLKKVFYGNYDDKGQEVLFELFAFQRFIHYFLLTITFLFIVVQPFIPVIILVLWEPLYLLILPVQLVLCINILVCYLPCAILLIFFYDPFLDFLSKIGQKIYFQICSMKGKAISRSDLKAIKHKNLDLYGFMSSQDCVGFCLSTCYDILRILKKGEIEFIGIKRLSYELEDICSDGKPYKIHVLYVNNGWAFDTYTQRQYPLERYHQLRKAKVFRSFNINDIIDMSFDDFKQGYKLELKQWCLDNNCSNFNE